MKKLLCTLAKSIFAMLVMLISEVKAQDVPVNPTFVGTGTYLGLSQPLPKSLHLRLWNIGKWRSKRINHAMKSYKTDLIHLRQLLCPKETTLSGKAKWEVSIPGKPQ